MKNKQYIFLIIVVILMAILLIHGKIAIACVFYEITGLYCPGCGITRSILSLIDGNIYQAFRYNPIIFIDIPLIMITSIIDFIYKDNKKVKKVTNAIYIMLLIITLVFGVLRNIPYFSFLAPTTL